MSTPPDEPKIYHITHVENLPSILLDGVLLSDAAMIARGGPNKAIGMSDIKRRRVEEIEVTCHPSTKVGEYVPFYFCPRSVMLYVIHCANHESLTYRGGQGPIVHLQADFRATRAWARANQVPWCFTRSNAGSYYVDFFHESSDLDELDWRAIANTDFRSNQVKECKQAEFLLHREFPFELVERIGVMSEAVGKQVVQALRGQAHKPVVDVVPEWYY